MRLGLGWRAELGAGILANLDCIGVIEVMAEDFFDADRAQRRALRFLRDQVPVVVHATSLGLASTEPVDARGLDAVARVVEWLEPELWSEHLAFVRAGGSEIGHLAAPPRNDATLEGLARNVEVATRVTGSKPLLENVASLVDPPLSTYVEDEWLCAVTAVSGCGLLLDLHNVYANSVNFGFSATDVVRRVPAPRAIHLAGGKRIERGRVLDDHQHAVPDAVYELLALVDARDAPVILERDGAWPEIEVLLREVERAADVIATSASGDSHRGVSFERVLREQPDVGVQKFLATLYTDAGALRRFLDDPRGEVARAHLPAELAELDRDDLALAARGFERKRAAKCERHRA